MNIPGRDEFIKGCQEFENHEARDAMYKVATFLIEHFWGQPSKMADGLGVLLLTWNQAFYRYGSFNFDKLERTLSRNMSLIESFRKRDIAGLLHEDKENISRLFNELLDCLKIDGGKKDGTRSPVSVAKTLHLLAPAFFPLWDDKIAKAYGCYYHADPAGKYLSFCEMTKDMSAAVRQYGDRSDKTIVKLIDEYNYSKHTKKWI